jgi:hypothetical protein
MTTWVEVPLGRVPIARRARPQGWCVDPMQVHGASLQNASTRYTIRRCSWRREGPKASRTLNGRPWQLEFYCWHGVRRFLRGCIEGE